MESTVEKDEKMLRNDKINAVVKKERLSDRSHWNKYTLGPRYRNMSIRQYWITSVFLYCKLSDILP